MTTLRAATVHDLPGVYPSASSPDWPVRDASSTYADPDLLGHIWVGPYLLYPDAVALVLQDAEGIAGTASALPTRRPTSGGARTWASAAA